jgi:hypothetical protein
MTLTLSAAIVIANVAYSAHAFREWRRESRARLGMAAAATRIVRSRSGADLTGGGTPVRRHREMLTIHNLSAASAGVS